MHHLPRATKVEGQRYRLAVNGISPYRCALAARSSSMKDMRVAIVTGAAQGIGRRTAEVLGEAGYTLFLLDLQPCNETLSALHSAGVEAGALIGDITDESLIAQAVSLVAERWGRADLLVNNAGISFIAPAETVEASAFRLVLEVNPRRTLRSLPSLRRRHARATTGQYRQCRFHPVSLV